jgi:heme-degrading monooxygenase HmoA
LAPGFRAHAVYPVEGGFVVMELWDDAEDYRAFFESAVKPNMPDGVRFEIQVMERHNIIGL